MTPVPTSTKTLTTSQEDMSPEVSLKSNGLANGNGVVTRNGKSNGYSNGGVRHSTGNGKVSEPLDDGHGRIIKVILKLSEIRDLSLKSN